MNKLKGDKKVLSMSLVLLSLFIFIFFTRGYYSELISSMEINESKNKEFIDKDKETGDLSAIKKELEALSKKEEEGMTKEGENSDFDEIKKYLQNVSEDEIIREIYSSVSSVGTRNGQIKIKSLSMSEGVENELGFMESKINISAKVSNEKTMRSFLDYLVNESKYKFFITEFTMPKSKKTTPAILRKDLNIEVPIIVFYTNDNKKVDAKQKRK